MNKLSAILWRNWRRFSSACQSAQAFQKRIWVVSIQKNEGEQGAILNDTFIVSEDSFSSPMSWMHQRGYTLDALKKVDNMKRSQIVKVSVEEGSHRLMRVK